MSASPPSPENVALAPGAVIGGKYRIDGFLGAGGMGVVLSATHLELGAPVAIKIVRDDLAQHEEVMSRLLFEARAAARMRSSHIVRVLDVARLDSGAPYIVMEQLEGLDLGAVLADAGTLPVSDAVHYVLQACEGLSEAHGLGIVHRDLKPANLFLANTPEGLVLKILDFGISKNIGTAVRSAPRSTLTKRGATVGSPFYMSPEQMRASPTLDGRADVWSLGAILFELLTGHCPFEADSAALICSKVMLDEAPSLRDFVSDAPTELDAIIQRCLQKEPEQRFQSASELASALREFAVARRAAVAAELATAEHELAKPRRFGTLLGLAAVSAVLAFAAVSFWRLQGRGEWARWSGGNVAAAEIPGESRPPRAARAYALPESRAVPVSVAAASPVPPAPSSAGPERTPVPPISVFAARPIPSPRYQPGPRKSAAAPAQDGVDARYDL